MSVTELLRAQCAQPAPQEVAALVAAVRERFGSSLNAVIFYGSGRRGVDLQNGVIDLWAVVDDRRAVERGWRAWLGGLLPPNVYFLEANHAGASVRAKIGLFTLAELRQASAKLESYVWGRLAQPVSLVFARDEQIHAQVIEVLAACVETFLTNALPLATGARPMDVWRIGLARSYASELRAEGRGRASDIVGADGDYYERLTLTCRPDAFVRNASGAWAAQPQSTTAQMVGRWRWRAVIGKFLSVLRLLKGLYTFEGGLDYIAWKLARHSGQAVEIPERVRRWPLIFVWGLMWRLYRRGVFR